MPHAMIHVEQTLNHLKSILKAQKGGWFGKKKPLDLKHLREQADELEKKATELEHYARELKALSERFKGQIDKGTFTVDVLSKELNVLDKIVQGNID